MGISRWLLLLPGAIALTAAFSLWLMPQADPLTLLQHASRPLSPLDWQLLLDFRLPRLIVAFFSGALLASAGSLVQARFQNPLAEPGLIGISGGAALTAAAALSCGVNPALVSLLAFAGGLAALGISWLMSLRTADSHALILAGIAVNALLGSLLTLLISTLPDGSLRTITFWLMGSFANADWPQASTFLLAAPLLLLLAWREWRLLNAMQLGLPSAWHLGFAIRSGSYRVVGLAALASALVVANCGMVGFVGLMAPHLARQLIGSHSRRLLLLAPLLGGWLCILADWLAHGLLYPAEIPVGVITSLAGAPFFLWLLWHRGQQHA